MCNSQSHKMISISESCEGQGQRPPARIASKILQGPWEPTSHSWARVLMAEVDIPMGNAGRGRSWLGRQNQHFSPLLLVSYMAADSVHSMLNLSAAVFAQKTIRATINSASFWGNAASSHRDSHILSICTGDTADDECDIKQRSGNGIPWGDWINETSHSLLSKSSDEWRF